MTHFTEFSNLIQSTTFSPDDLFTPRVVALTKSYTIQYHYINTDGPVEQKYSRLRFEEILLDMADNGMDVELLFI